MVEVGRDLWMSFRFSPVCLCLFSTWQPITGHMKHPVLNVWPLQCLCKGERSPPSECSPESCQPSLTQGAFAGPCLALGTWLWRTSLSSSLLSLASLLRTNPAPSSRPWMKMLNRTDVTGLQLDFVPLPTSFCHI